MFYLYSFKCANLEKSLLFSCIGGYKYLYMGNLSRQVRCTLGWSRVTVSSAHLFKWACKKMNIPPRSIVFSSNYTCSVTHSTSDCLFPAHDLKHLVYIWCFRSKCHFLHSCEWWYKRVTDIWAARVCTLYVCEMQSEQLTKWGGAVMVPFPSERRWMVAQNQISNSQSLWNPWGAPQVRYKYGISINHTTHSLNVFLQRLTSLCVWSRKLEPWTWCAELLIDHLYRIWLLISSSRSLQCVTSGWCYNTVSPHICRLILQGYKRCGYLHWSQYFPTL